jgi:hypothetical protein
MSRKSAVALVGLVSVLGLAGCSHLEPGGRDRGVKITELPDRLRVEVNGELFTEYLFQGTNHVYFYPVLGPHGLPMTRNFPMKADSEDEEHDHPHHRSLWYSHGAVNGIDFWSESPNAGRILHDKFLEVTSARKSGLIRSQNKWVAPDGEVVCTDERTFRVYSGPAAERWFDFDITLRAGDKPVVLGDTKEGSMGIRVRGSITEKKGKGTISNAEGKKGELKVGQYADFVVLSTDLTKVTPKEILKTEVLRTVVGGRVVYQKN